MSERAAVLEVRRLALAGLELHERSPRDHPAEGSPAWDVLARSLEFDYFDPLVWNETNGRLVAGGFRKKVLMGLGFTHADVSIVRYDEAMHLARMVAANSHSGDWNTEILATLARDIELAGLDPALALWKPAELAALLDPPKVDDDSQEVTELVSKAEELQTKWQVKAGDLYQIGAHRLFCGDCALQETWALLLDGRGADMWWTDPPYNVNYDRQQKKLNGIHKRQGQNVKVKAEKILNDSMSARKYSACMQRWMTSAFINSEPGAAIYVSHADSFGTITRNAFEGAGFKLSQGLVWVKNHATLGRNDYHWQHEPILYGWKPGAPHHWQGGYKQRSVIDDEKPLSKMSKAELVKLVNQMRNERESDVVREAKSDENTLHPTVKPLPLVARHVWNSSRRTEVVADLFGGSGTTLVAAEHTGRCGRAPELDPKYCAVILERLSTRGLEVRLLGNHAATQ